MYTKYSSVNRKYMQNRWFDVVCPINCILMKLERIEGKLNEISGTSREYHDKWVTVWWLNRCRKCITCFYVVFAYYIDKKRNWIIYLPWVYDPTRMSLSNVKNVELSNAYILLPRRRLGVFLFVYRPDNLLVFGKRHARNSRVHGFFNPKCKSSFATPFQRRKIRRFGSVEKKTI